mgnify:CR=1 FL=1
MKKILAILATLTLSLTACADRQHLIEYSELPAQAQNFIQKYFNVSDIAYVERERDGLHNEFKVYLKKATEIDFDYHGNLESIDCQISPVPEGIVPQLIVDFVRLHHPDNFIVEYSIDHRSLEVELSNGFTLVFDMEGNFIRIDD